LPQRFRRSWCRSNLGVASSTETHCWFVRSVRRRVGPEGPAVCVLDYSLGVHQRSPLRQYRCRASSPGRAEARPSARSCHAPSMFRPCRSSRLRRFTPLDTLQVCCTLHPAMGFATFPVGSCPLPEGWGREAGLPRWRHTLRSFPLRSRSPRVTARRFPHVVAPGVWPRSARVATVGSGAFPRSLDLRALLRCEVRCELAGVAAG
jgi:hypothetical protein